MVNRAVSPARLGYPCDLPLKKNASRNPLANLFVAFAYDAHPNDYVLEQPVDYQHTEWKAGLRRPGGKQGSEAERLGMSRSAPLVLPGTGAGPGSGHDEGQKPDRTRLWASKDPIYRAFHKRIRGEVPRMQPSTLHESKTG